MLKIISNVDVVTYNLFNYKNNLILLSKLNT